MSVIAAGRSFHDKAVLLDTCTISRVGPLVFNENTGTYTQTSELVFSGACHIAPITNSRSMDEEFGGEIVITAAYLLKVPWSATGIRPEDEVVVHSAADPLLAGRVFRVHQVMTETHLMSRRIVCEAVSTSELDESESSGEESSSDESSSS